MIRLETQTDAFPNDHDILIENLFRSRGATCLNLLLYICF